MSVLGQTYAGRTENRGEIGMLRYILKRLIQSLVTILLVVSIVFLLMRLMPSDYFFTEDELIKFTDEQKEDKLRRLGLLDPPLVQLGNFYKNMLKIERVDDSGKVTPDGTHTRLVFNLGDSMRLEKGQPVTKVIAQKLGISMHIGLIALALSLVLGVVLGVLQANFKDRLIDHIGTAYTVVVNAVPHLVIYTVIMILGASWFNLPMRYSGRLNTQLSMVLPIVCLSVGSTAGYMLWTRRYMVDELNKDYIRLAKLKGLSSRKVMFRHVLRNAFVPLAQYLPYSILLTVGGSLLVETFFSVPGMGPELTKAIGRYDLNLVQGIVLLYATLGILGVFLGDLLMTLIDPRIKLTGKGDVR